MFCTNLTLHTAVSQLRHNVLPFEELFIVWQRFQIKTLLTFLPGAQAYIKFSDVALRQSHDGIFV
jgi:hypothetical protein